MSIEAMKQALEAIQDLRGYRPDIDKAIEALRTAIQQAEAQQPATTEPAGYLYDFKYDDEIVRDWFTQNIDEIQFRPATCLNIRPLYAHPAPCVPDALEMPVENGTEYDYCSGRSAGYAEGWNDCRAAMLAASPAQKGGE